MRTLLTFIALVWAALVPCSLAPGWISNASGSAITKPAPVVAVRLDATLGILPLDGAEGDLLFDATSSATPEQSAGPSTPQMICENGVCRLVGDDAPSGAAGSQDESAEPWSLACEQLKQLGASQIRVQPEADGTWRCSCLLPVSASSHVMRRFEASGSSAVAAAEEVKKLIESWRLDR